MLQEPKDDRQKLILKDVSNEITILEAEGRSPEVALEGCVERNHYFQQLEDARRSCVRIIFKGCIGRNHYSMGPGKKRHGGGV